MRFSYCALRPISADTTGIIRVFLQRPDTLMEAEQLNIIANRLTDLAQRTDALRRYL
jgi:hypothetical protein